MPDPARARQNYEALKAALDTALQAYEEQPEQIAELLAFKSKFHTYSLNNSVLIQRANPGATYVASFDRWKELGYSVKRGQRGIKILVPRTSTLFRTVDETGRPVTKRLRDATPEEKEKIRSGEIETYQRTHFSTGSVFDISQTTCPPEDYPKFYHMGYPSEQHAALADAMTTYAAAKGIEVLTQDVTSIALRGFFRPSDNTITLSDKLNDTERLSTLSHELGHAMAFAADAKKEQALPSEVRELEADGVSIMLQTTCGFPLTQSRITHFANAYRACMQREDFSFEAFLKNVDQIYSQTYQELRPYMESALQIFKKETKDHNEVQVAAAEEIDAEKAESPVSARTIAASTGAAAILASEPVQETVAENAMKDFMAAIANGKAAIVCERPELVIDNAKRPYYCVSILTKTERGTYGRSPYPEDSVLFTSAEKALLFAREHKFMAVPESTFLKELEQHPPMIVEVARKMGYSPVLQSNHGEYAYQIEGGDYLTFNDSWTDYGLEGGPISSFIREFSDYAKEHFDVSLPENLHTDDGIVEWLQKNFPGKFTDLKAEDVAEPPLNPYDWGNYDPNIGFYEPEVAIDEANDALMKKAVSSALGAAEVEPETNSDENGHTPPSGGAPPSFAQQVDEALRSDTTDRTSQQNALYVSDTPKVLTDLGLRQLPMLITQRHLKNIVHPKDPANTRYHGLPVEQIKQLPQMLESPAMVARSLTHADDLVVITSQADPDNLPIMVSIRPDGRGRYALERIDSNFITSVYGRTNFLSIDENGDLSPDCFLGRVMQAGGLLYQDKEKSRQLARDAQLQLPRGLTSAGSSSREEKTPDGSIDKDSVAQNSEPVKSTDRKEEEPAPAVHSMEARAERPRRRDEQYREEMDAVKNRINILDLAQDLGYHVVRDGTHHSLEEHDSVVFYESTNTFCRFSTAQNTSDGRPIGGSVIDFVLHFNEADGLGLPVHTAADAIRYLKDTYRLGTEPAQQHTPTSLPKEKEAEKPPFRLPDVFQSGESAEKSHLYAYLCKTRAIDHEVVHTCQQRGLLYEDTAHNVVFVGRSQDGKEIFGTRRSTWSHSHWRRDVAGSDQSSGWYVDNKSDTLYVTEAPIDALSIMTLRKDAGKDPMDVSYLATTGTGKLNVLTRRLKENPNIQHLVLAFDNDDAGNLAAKRAARILQEQFPAVELRRYVVKEGKDVNEYLQKVQERKKTKSPSQGPEKGPKRKRTITPNLEPA